WKFRPEPLPEAIDEAEEQEAWRMRYDAILSAGTLEKVMLVGLDAVIFSQMLPDFTGSTPLVFIGLAARVVIHPRIPPAPPPPPARPGRPAPSRPPSPPGPG